MLLLYFWQYIYDENVLGIQGTSIYDYYLKTKGKYLFTSKLGTNFIVVCILFLKDRKKQVCFIWGKKQLYVATTENANNIYKISESI